MNGWFFPFCNGQTFQIVFLFGKVTYLGFCLGTYIHASNVVLLEIRLLVDAFVCNYTCNYFNSLSVYTVNLYPSNMICCSQQVSPMHELISVNTELYQK